jgi:DHA1 family tetracycline resistance protein-like MFS transporter
MSEPQIPGDEAQPAPSRGALGIIFLIVLLDLMGFGIIIPLLPFYVKDPEHNPLKVTLLFSIYSICQFIGAPILGAISDRKGRKPVLAFSQLGSVVGYVMLGLATQPQLGFSAVAALAMIYASRVIDGFTGGNISTAQAYISDVTTTETRSRAMALIGMAFGLGFAVGPFVGGVLGHINRSLPAYVAAAFSLLAAVLTFIRLPESRVHKPVDIEAWLHPSQFAPVLRRPILLQLLLISFVTMAAFVMMESTVGIFLKQHFGYAEKQVGWFFGYIGLVIVIVQGGIIRRVLKTVGDWPLAILGPLLVAVGMAIYALTAIWPLLSVLLIAGAINASGRSCQQPTISSLLARFSGREEQGTVFGLYNGLGSLARVFGPLVAGLTYPYLRNAGPFVIAGIVTAAGALWTAALAVQAKSYKSGMTSAERGFPIQGSGADVNEPA